MRSPAVRSLPSPLPARRRHVRLLPLLFLGVFPLLFAPLPVRADTPAADAPLAHHPQDPAPTGWLQVETEHFRIIYRERDQETVEEIRAIEDRVWRDTTAYMAYQPRERVPVVLYSNTAPANGFFSPYPPHIALFVSSPVGPWLGAHTRSWIETVLVHEVIHYLHLTQPIGFFGSPSRLFGPLMAAAGTVFMPGWTVEGVTVHGESHLIPGGRGDNPFFEMQAVAPILEGRMYSYDQAGFSSSYAPAGRIYTAGYLMVDYLRREYGPNAFNVLNRTFQQAPFLGMRRAIRRTTGVSARRFYADMVTDLEEQHRWRHALPQGEIVSPAGPGEWVLPIPTERGLITGGYDFNRGPGLYLQAPPGGSNEGGSNGAPPAEAQQDGWHLLAPVALAQKWSWTVNREGTTAVVSLGMITTGATITPVTGESFADLFLIELPDGDGRVRDHYRPASSRRITRGLRLFYPALSPAGDDLVAVERRGSYNRLVRVDPDTGAVTPLWEPEETTLAAPVFSPAGDLLALTANYRGRQDLVILQADTGTELARLTAGPGLRLRAYHFPRFAATPELELWYGGEPDSEPTSGPTGEPTNQPDNEPTSEPDGASRRGELALYRSAVIRDGQEISLAAPERVLRDRVAAWGGFPLVDATSTRAGAVPGLYYGSYSADGYVIRRAGLEALPPRPPSPSLAQLPPRSVAATAAGMATETQADDPVPHAVPAAAPLATADVTAGVTVDVTVDRDLRAPRTYRDIPRPVLWLPQLSYRSGGAGGDQFDLGVFSTAPSYLGRHTVDISLFYNPDAHQPSGQLQYTWAPGGTRWSALIEQQYETIADPVRTKLTTTAALFASRTLLLDQRPGYYRALAGGAGAEYRASTITPDTVAFRTALESDHSEFSREVRTSVLLRAVRARTGAPRDFFGTPGGEIVTRFDLDPQLETTSGVILRAHPLRAVSGPVGALQFVPAAYLTTSMHRAAPDRLPYRSGGFAERYRAELAGLGRLELRMPLGIHDSAWRGLGTTGSGISVYLEQGAADIDYAVAGGEFTMDLFFNMILLRATVGLAVRVPHRDSTFGEDRIVYVRLGGPVGDLLGAGRLY